MSLLLLLKSGPGGGGGSTGAVSLGVSFGATTSSMGTQRAASSLALQATFATTWATTARGQTPSASYQAAFTSDPLSSTPVWVELGSRVRGLSTTRGRSYEFDRMETGTMGAVLDNRDAALSPENTASPYNPIKSTRPIRALLVWDKPYPLFRGISEGFPQAYTHLGLDAHVELQANDMFYALNNARFTPGTAQLQLPMTGGVAQNTEETITVDSTNLPMPQVVPFTISVSGLTSEWPVEEMEVLEIVADNSYRVLRSAETTYEHPGGAAITTKVVSFGQETSGERIQNVLYAVGFPVGGVVSGWPTGIVSGEWWDLEQGQSLIAPSENLAQVSPLEHINLVTAAEFGRFFVSREGKFAFRDRHSVVVDNLTPAFVFKDGATGSQVPYVLEAPLEHTEEKLYNRVRITIRGGDYDGQVVDVSDQDSIDDHFERIFEREFPYANLNDAESAAAQFVLTRNSEDTLRLPAISVQGASNPSVLWPLLLSREIGDRATFRYQPVGGGSEIVKDVAIESISHRKSISDHAVIFQCSEVDSTNYWILGLAGYTELDSTTRVGF